MAGNFRDVCKIVLTQAWLEEATEEVVRAVRKRGVGAGGFLDPVGVLTPEFIQTCVLIALVRLLSPDAFKLLSQLVKGSRARRPSTLTVIVKTIPPTGKLPAETPAVPEVETLFKARGGSERSAPVFSQLVARVVTACFVRKAGKVPVQRTRTKRSQL